MGEHPNARLIREFHELQGRFYRGGELGPAAALLADDVVWHAPGRSAISGRYEGKQEVLDYFKRRRELARASFRIELHDVLASDDLVVLLAGGRATLHGVEREWETVGLFRVREWQITECRLLPFDQYLFDEIWGGPAAGTEVGRR